MKKEKEVNQEVVDEEVEDDFFEEEAAEKEQKKAKKKKGKRNLKKIAIIGGTVAGIAVGVLAVIGISKSRKSSTAVTDPNSSESGENQNQQPKDSNDEFLDSVKDLGI